MTTPLFTETKWPQTLGLRGQLGGAGGEAGWKARGEASKCSLSWERWGGQPSTANRSFARFTLPPSAPAMAPPCSLPANPRREPMKRVRNLTPSPGVLAATALFSLRPPTRRMHVPCKHWPHSQASPISSR